MLYQPMSSPMMNRMLGRCPGRSVGAGTCCCACACLVTPGPDSTEAAISDPPLSSTSRRLNPWPLGAASSGLSCGLLAMGVLPSGGGWRTAVASGRPQLLRTPPWLAPSFTYGESLGCYVEERSRGEPAKCGQGPPTSCPRVAGP